MSEEIRTRRIEAASAASTTDNQRNPGRDQAEKMEAWRKVIQNVNRLSNASFSHHVVQIILARQRLTGSEPSRAPSPTEQPREAKETRKHSPSAPGAITKEMADAMEQVARNMRKIQMENR
ncbi:hypothetical protein HY994_05460 [Candidatus Micrarchaeota archaeon]|nr:hypothetical protein [Candidatus Micrarchaeota archaeon]